MAPQPPAIGKATFTVKLRDPAGRPVTGAALQLEANMAHPGMAPPMGPAREVLPGEYAAELELTMAGAWFLLVEGRLADGRRLPSRWPITPAVCRSPP